MSVALNANYIAELNKKAQNEPVIIIEIEFDSGTLKFGTHSVFSDVLTCIDKISSTQNKLDTSKGYSTRGNIKFDIIGRENFKTLIKNEHPKNRRVNRYDGFVGLAFSDYVKTFTGTIQSWTRNDDRLTFTVDDDAQKVTTKLPVENDAGTQTIDYLNTNPIDMMLDILENQLGIDASLIDIATFENQRDIWRNSWIFHRVLTKPQEANKILNELQETTFGYIFHDGQKISYKADEPPPPASTVLSFSDTFNVKSLTASSGYSDSFFNKVEIYYDYDESDTDETDNYETRTIISNIDSQSASEWDETKTKTIKSKGLRTYTWIQPTNVTGVEINHVSKDNGLSAGATGSVINYDLSNNTLQWTAPDGTIGSAVVVNSDGKYRLFDSDLNKSIRVVVDVSALPAGNQNDTIDITNGAGGTYSSALANKWLNKYRDPATSVTFKTDINNINNDSNLLAITDTVKLTTDDAFDFGRDSWTDEQMLITSMRPDFNSSTATITAIQKRAGNQAGLRKGFIAPAGQSDYPSATTAEKEYAYIGDASNLVNAGTEDGYYII